MVRDEPSLASCVEKSSLLTGKEATKLIKGKRSRFRVKGIKVQGGQQTRHQGPDGSRMGRCSEAEQTGLGEKNSRGENNSSSS